METHHSQTGKGVALPNGMVLGQYRLLHKIGQGGFGITYLAEHTASGEQVVVKENLPTFYAYRDHNSLQVHPLDDADSAENYARTLQRFVEEARLLAYLNHPNIVQVNEAFEALGTAYYVMPYIPGKELHKAAPAVVNEAWLQPILKAVLSALGYLHSQNLLHRDMKPGNILLQEDGTPILIDFGTARALQTERSATMIGTPGYTPIEQITVHGNRGPWTDIYALGATCYRLITGERPPEAFNRVEEVDPYRPLAYRDELQGLFSPAVLHSIDTALAVRAKDRWQSAQEWLEALENPTNISVSTSSPAINISVITSSPVNAGTPAVLPAPSRRKSHGLVIAALITALLLSGGGFAVYSYLNTAEQQHALAERELTESQRLTREHEEQMTREKAEREEAARLAQEKAKQEEEERIFQEQVVKEEEERLAQEQAARKEAERLAKEKKAPEEARRKLRELGITDFDAEILHAYNKPETLKLLIAAGANVNKENQKGETPLFKAVSSNSIECVKILISAPGIDVNKGLYKEETDWLTTEMGSPLACALQRNHTECVKLLLGAPGIDVNKEGEYKGTPLSWALENKHTEYVKLLLAAPGIDVNKKNSYGQTHLYTAAEAGHAEYVKLLLDAPGIDTSEWNPLTLAVLKNDTEAIKKLIQSHANVNSGDVPPLFWAIKLKRTACLKLLLATPGIDVNKENGLGWTPLAEAAMSGHAECVKLLLAVPGINVNKGNEYKTPLHIILETNKNIECIKLLLAAPGIDVNELGDYNGQFSCTPLYLAAQENEVEIVKLLLAVPGINVNKANTLGDTLLDTPLDAAADDSECARLIRAAGGRKGR